MKLSSRSPGTPPVSKYLSNFSEQVLSTLPEKFEKPLRYLNLHRQKGGGVGFSLCIQFQGDGPATIQAIMKHKVERVEVGKLIPHHLTPAERCHIIFDPFCSQNLFQKWVEIREIGRASCRERVEIGGYVVCVEREQHRE